MRSHQSPCDQCQFESTESRVLNRWDVSESIMMTKIGRSSFFPSAFGSSWVIMSYLKSWKSRIHCYAFRRTENREKFKNFHRELCSNHPQFIFPPRKGYLEQVCHYVVHWCHVIFNLDFLNFVPYYTQSHQRTVQNHFVTQYFHETVNYAIVSKEFTVQWSVNCFKKYCS